jgi:hypothetical protein
LGDGQITAGVNVGNRNVVAVWNGSQTTFHVVDNDLGIEGVSSPISAIFNHCESYSSRVYCGGSTSDLSLNSDCAKSALFAEINPDSGQIENHWQFDYAVFSYNGGDQEDGGTYFADASYAGAVGFGVDVVSAGRGHVSQELPEIEYDAVPELTNITGGATADDGLLLWGHKDDKARIVKLPFR